MRICNGRGVSGSAIHHQIVFEHSINCPLCHELTKKFELENDIDRLRAEIIELKRNQKNEKGE